MGRIRQNIEVVGKDRWTLFDSGARYSYIVRDATEGLVVQNLVAPRASALGGRTHRVEEVCVVFAKVDGHDLEFQASVIDEIGHDEEGRRIEILFGAIAMQLWGIRLDPQNERLDLSHVATDFVEFWLRCHIRTTRQPDARWDVEDEVFLQAVTNHLNRTTGTIRERAESAFV